MGLEQRDEVRHIRLIRHAKSAEGGADHERTLNPRGTRDGAFMQNWLQQQPHAAEWVWTSSATRARHTAQFVHASCATAQLAVQSSLYLAGPEEILDCLQQTPGDVRSVALVAHNPGITYCANLLAGQTITDNLVTFATVLLRVSQPWPQLSFGSAEFVSLHTPKGLAAQKPV